MSISLKKIERELIRHRPGRKRLRALLNRAAVAMILRERHGETEVLMIERAERRGDPWSGHMAFPGGRMEARDRHGFDVAVRETGEEIGLRLGPSDPCIGRLSEIMTHFQWRRRAMVVTPYLFRLEREVQFELNHEVSAVIWIPISFLANRDNRKKMLLNRRGVKIPLSCYTYQGRRIWGLSLMMLDELLKILE